MFWPLIFLERGGRPSICLDPTFKIQPSTDHGAKFCGDRLTVLEDTVAKKKIINFRKLSLPGELINLLLFNKMTKIPNMKFSFLTTKVLKVFGYKNFMTQHTDS